MIIAETEKECTFQPALKDRDENPSFENFLKKQEDYIARKKQFTEDNQREKEREEKMNLQDRPSISESSKILAENKGSCYERLTTKKGSEDSKTKAREIAAQKAGLKIETPV